jgi:hypothetical protein
MLIPISRMYGRYELEKQDSDVTAFYGLMFFGEFLTKIVTACVLAGVADDRDRNRYGIQRDLVRADGIGEWANALDRALTGPSAQFLIDEFKDFQRELMQKNEDGDWQKEALDNMQLTLKCLQIDFDSTLTKLPLRQWFKWFALLRNKTRGHGATLGLECAVATPFLEKSINCIVENLSIFTWEWAYLHQNISGKYRVSGLSAKTESFLAFKQGKAASLGGGVYVHRGAPIRIDLFESDADLTDFFVPNGQFRGTSYEVISYISNQNKRIDAPQWLSPSIPLPDSETHGAPHIDQHGNSMSNVPSVSNDYIERRDLERELENALVHDRHEIVTLGGPGGIGKTSLALTVIRTLQAKNTPRYELIIWFSARDIDLMLSGPKSVRPHGVSLDDFAKEYVHLVGATISGKVKPEQILANALTTTPIGPTLFVFDNFETVTSPAAVFKWIDTYIRAPNKVLITTRTRDFVGDLPITVFGMNNLEATKLIESVALRLEVSDLLTVEYVQALIDESSGHPYVIKIMLGEISKQNRLIKPQRIIAAQDHILQALFERTYSALTPASQRIFLLLSTWRSIVPSLAIEAVVMRNSIERFDVRFAIEELKRLSFIEELTVAGQDESFISLPLAAQVFGQKKLNASSLKAVIEADSDLLQEFGAIRKDGISAGVQARVSHLIKALAKRVATGKENIESLRPMLEFVASRVPAAWLEISRLYIEEGKDAGKDWAKDALRRLIESGMSRNLHAVAWQQLADLNRAENDYQGEVQALAELSDMPDTLTDELSRLAHNINRVFASAKRDGKVPFQPDERKYLVGKLIRHLESSLAHLDATDMSRLAWLHLHVGDEGRAREITEKGLSMDSGNEYCLKLAQKFGGGFGHADH